MRRVLAPTAALTAVLVFVAVANAQTTKLTFNDVTYPDGTTGEIEASVKNTNKSHLTYCGYFSDKYGASLGYYEEPSPTAASTDPADVETFCLANFDNRYT